MGVADVDLRPGDGGAARCARLSGELALDMFERLYEEAHTDLEVQTVEGLLRGLFEDGTRAT